jgi:hypothetical protein
MNERIVSEITLMSDEAIEIMLKKYKEQVHEWCHENISTIKNKENSIENISMEIRKSLTSFILLINLK